MSSRNGRYRAALGGLILWALLAGSSAAQSVGQAEQPNAEQQEAKRVYADRKTGDLLACSPASDGQGDAYRCKAARKPNLGERVWRWIFRAGRDPIAIFTFALLGVGVWQVGIAQRTAHRQLRAYLAPDFTSITDGSNLTPPTEVGKVRGAVVMKNFGQTPAYNVVTWSAITVIRVSEEHTLLPPQDLGPVSQATLGPTQNTSQFRTFPRALTEHEISEIQTGERAVYMYGRSTYRDIFGKSHSTNFRLRYTDQWPPTGSPPIMNYCDTGNEAD